MIARPSHLRASFPLRASFNGTVALTLFWLTLVGFQLLRSMRIDAFELTGTRLDLLGYWAAFGLSLFFGLRMLKQGRMMVIPVVLTIILIIYITMIMVITAPSESVISLLFSRFGLVVWFVLGIGFSEVLFILSRAGQRPGANLTNQLVLVVSALVSIPIVLFAQEILASPIRTNSYQVVATSATIYLLVFACVIGALRGRSGLMLATVIYVCIGTILSIAVTLLQSTSIVAIWVGLLGVFFRHQIRRTRTRTRLVISAFGLVGLVGFLNSNSFESIINTTRFSVFFSNTGEFSPLASRASIIGSFGEQFAVSPLVGHFRAEMMAGDGAGYYLHSLPLSFLTHTGLLGTIIVGVILFLSLSGRTTPKSKLNPVESQVTLTMWLVLSLGTLSCFLTWSVFWFMLGVLCRRPMKL